MRRVAGGQRWLDAPEPVLKASRGIIVSENQKRAAAAMALTEVQPGMRIGLGTGSTAWHFVDLLGGEELGHGEKHGPGF